MTAAKNLEDTQTANQEAGISRSQGNPQNRRQIFRIADPDFANMRVIVQGMHGPVECTCLDISAVGLGILVPYSAFETADPGMILEYEIYFGPLSPVKGLAIVANRAETSLTDQAGNLLRLGLRFSDAEHSRSENLIAKKRRSERFYLSEAVRPLCVCNDPLWFGELLTISILDFSLHGMSGVVSAKKTVFAEGLRTVFQLAFPYIGIIEVPVRIIYANPTDDPKIFRIGCEFVRRNSDFTSAVEHFLKLFSFEKQSQRLGSSLLEKMIEPSAALLSDRHELELASNQFLEPLSDLSISKHVQIFPLYAKSLHRKAAENSFFRFELHTEHESDQKGGEEEEPLLGRQYLVVTIDDFKSFSQNELRSILSFLLYLCVVKKVHSFKISTATNTSLQEALVRLEAIGFLNADVSQNTKELEFSISDVKSCSNISRSLWLRSILPLARFHSVLGKSDFKGDVLGTLLFQFCKFAFQFIDALTVKAPRENQAQKF